MTAYQALRRGFQVLIRHPALLLGPLGADVVRLWLAYAGFPTGAAWPDRVTVLGAPVPTVPHAMAFLPSAFPTLGDLGVPLHPVLQPPTMGIGVLLISLLLVPLIEAWLQGALFGWLAAGVCGERVTFAVGVRRAWRAWPGLYIWALLLQLLRLFLAPPPSSASLTVVTLVLLLLFPLVPYAMGVRGYSLWRALYEAPRMLWGASGAWLGLALCTGVITWLVTAMWASTGGLMFVGLLLYPWLGSSLVAAATVLCLPPAELAAAERPAPRPSPATPWAPVGGLLVLVLATSGAALGARALNAWAGWQPSRLAALGGQFPPTILKVEPQPDGSELVVFRPNAPHQLGYAYLRTGRFGWRLQESQGQASTSNPLVVWTWGIEPYRRDRPGASEPPKVIIGEIHDNRVAYLQVGAERHVIWQDGPIFIVHTHAALHADSEIQVLDIAGHVLNPGGGKAP